MHMNMKSRKIVPMDISAGQDRDADMEKGLVDTAGKGGAGTN